MDFSPSPFVVSLSPLLLSSDLSSLGSWACPYSTTNQHTSCSAQRLRAWVSISSSHGSRLARGSVARDLVRLSVWGADMVGGMVGWMDG